MASIYDFTVKDRAGNDVSLADYKGKILMIVNTAIACELTPQYAKLQELYNAYHDKGFEILDFPCNQFAGQAPGTNEEIHAFCTGRFGITFPQFGKIDVNGPDADPLYVFLKSPEHGLGTKDIEWNFTKFLVDVNGNVILRGGPPVDPMRFAPEIDDLLK